MSPAHVTPTRVFVGFSTMLRKEVMRIFRVWSQTLLPSAVTMTLYLLIFGTFVGSRVGEIVPGISYIQFIVPGLIMMTVITNAFTNVVSTFYFAKFQKSIEEILVSPMPPWVVVAGFVAGGVFRGCLVGLIVLLVSLLFAPLNIHSYPEIFLFILLTSVLFSLAGLLNGMFAKSFDAITIVPTFVLTPLTYLGGVFYSIQALPPFWQTVSLFNPILYMVNGFRWGFLGFSDVSLGASVGVLLVFIVILGAIVFYLFNRGWGLKN